MTGSSSPSEGFLWGFGTLQGNPRLGSLFRQKASNGPACFRPLAVFQKALKDRECLLPAAALWQRAVRTLYSSQSCWGRTRSTPQRRK